MFWVGLSSFHALAALPPPQRRKRMNERREEGGRTRREEGGRERFIVHQGDYALRKQQTVKCRVFFFLRVIFFLAFDASGGFFL